MWLCRSRVLHTPHRGWPRPHRGEGGGRAAKAAGSLRVPGTKACPCWCPLRGCVVVASGVIVASTSSHARMVSFPECITCLFSVSRSCIAIVLEAVLSVRTGIPQHVHSVRRASLCTACNSTGTNGLATGGVFASPIRRTYFPLVASAACRDSDIETLRSIETRRSTWLKPQQLRSAEESAGRSAGRGWVQCCPWSPPLLPLPP